MRIRSFPRVAAAASLVALMMFLVGAVAHAQPDNRSAQAKLHYETGMAHFQLEEWDKAVEEWEAGFRIKPMAEFLYNIAQAYRLSQRPSKALAFYQKYLRMEPNAPNKAEVDRHIALLKELIAQQPNGDSPQARTPDSKTNRTVPQQAPAVTEPPANPTAPPAVVPPPSTQVPISAGTEPDATAQVSAHAPEKPITKKGWFWGVMAGVGAVVIAGVVVGVVLGTTSGDSTRIVPAVRF